MVHLIYYFIIIIIIHERTESKKPRRNVVWGPRCLVRGCGFVWTLGHSKNYLHSHSTLLYTSLITIKLEVGHPFLSTLCFLLNYDRWRSSHDFSVVILIHLYYLHVQRRTQLINSFFF